MSDLKSEFLFEFQALLDREAMVNVGNTPQGARRIVYVKSGTVEGPKMKGEVLPGGGDWVLSRPDGAGVLDVRVTLRSEEGDIIYVTYRGINYTSPEVKERQAKGETIDPSEIYFRTTPVFETASEKYSWLNRTIAVGVGRMIPGGVAYKVYGIL